MAYDFKKRISLLMVPADMETLYLSEKDLQNAVQQARQVTTTL